VTAIFPETRDRLGRIRSLAPDQVEAGLAWLARNDPLVFDATMRAAGASGVPESEPYCVVCRGKLGLFAGQDGWRHYRGDALIGIERYPVAHRVVIGWRPASVVR
jgi:hypothetical protein